jgi:hypothetical protein
LYVLCNILMKQSLRYLDLEIVIKTTIATFVSIHICSWLSFSVSSIVIVIVKTGSKAFYLPEFFYFLM